MPEPTEVPRVDVVDPLGVRGSIAAGDLAAFTKGGGRLVTTEEHTAERAQQHFASQSLGQRALEAAATAGPFSVVPQLAAQTISPQAGATFQSYAHGVNEGVTLGLGHVAAKEALEAVSPGAGKAYVKQLDDLKASEGGANLAGNVAGMVAGSMMAKVPGAGVVGRALPVGAIETAGRLTGGLAGRLTGGLAERGILGATVAGGVKMGVQGATEGALYGLAQGVTEDLIHDKELSAEHMFVSTGLGALTGGVLGGSLGGFGGALKGGARAVRPSLERALVDAADAVSAPGRAIGEAGESAAVQGARREAGGGLSELARVFGDVTDNKARKWSNNMAIDALGGTKKEIADAVARVPGGIEAIGEWTRKHIIDATGEGLLGGAVKAGSTGRADEMLERIMARNAATGAAIGELVKPFNVHVPLDPILAAGKDIVTKLEKDAGTVNAGRLLRQQMENLETALVNAGQMGTNEAGARTAPLNNLFYQRASLGKGIWDATQHDNAAHLAAKEWIRKFDTLVVEGIDKAAVEAGHEGTGAEIRALKKDLNHGLAAQDIAEGGARRLAGNNTIGLRVGMAAGTALMSGHPIAGLAGLALGPVLQHRGSAAGSVLLSRLADAGTISKISAKVGDWTERAARGVITPDASRALPKVATAQTGSTIQRAQQIIIAVRRMQADPQGVQQRLNADAATIGRFAPETSLAYTAVAMKAMTALADDMPKVPNVDPLDVNSPPRLTPDQAARVVQLATYADRPEALFRDLEAGRISPEGMALARKIMPRTVEQIEDSAYAEVSRRKVAGQPVDFSQRTRLTLLTGRPFDPLYQQANLAALQATNAPPPNVPQDTIRAEKSHKPINIPKSMQGSTLDRVSSR